MIPATTRTANAFVIISETMKDFWKMTIRIPNIIFNELFDEEPKVVFGLLGIMLMVHSFAVSVILIAVITYFHI